MEARCYYPPNNVGQHHSEESCRLNVSSAKAENVGFALALESIRAWIYLLKSEREDEA